MHLGHLNRPFVPLKPDSESWEPCPFNKVWDCAQAQISNIVKKWGGGGMIMMSCDQSFTQKGGCAFFLSAALHTHKTVSRDIFWRCYFQLKGPVTALDCILLKENNLVLAARVGPKISFLACLWVLVRSLHRVMYWSKSHPLILCLIFCLDSPMVGSGPTNWWAKPSLANALAIFFTLTP